jgi:trigger factor
LSNALKIDTQPLEDRQVQLTIEVPDDRYRAAMHSAARRMSKREKIPGFRPGKVPFEIVVGRYGEEAVFEEALEKLGQEVYRQALEDSELEPFAPGSLNEVVSKEPLVLRYSIPLAPEVDLKKYRKVRVKFEPPEVADEAVNSMMEDLRQRQALIEPADRAIRLSDVAVIDVEGRLKEPDENEEELIVKESGISLLVEDDTDWPFEGVAQLLVGREVGEELSADHTFSDDYPTESLRGKAAAFQISVQEVKSRIVPEWTDDVARNLGDYEDLLDLRIKVRESLTSNAEREAESQYAEQVIGKVVEAATIDHPPLLVEQEVDDLLHDLHHRLEAQGLAIEDYLKVEEKTDQDLRDELRPRAVERVQRALVLGQLIESEGLEVQDSEIDEHIQSLSDQLQDPDGSLSSALKSDSGRRRIRNDLLFDKAVQFLVAVAKGEDPLKPPEVQEGQSD